MDVMSTFCVPVASAYKFKIINYLQFNNSHGTDISVVKKLKSREKTILVLKINV